MKREPRWPLRCHYLSDLGYVVWRDVFEGRMRCALEEAVRAHKTAVFVKEADAAHYVEYRNTMALAAMTKERNLHE